MELEIKKSVDLEDGLHTGVIESVDYRSQPFQYTDIVIKVDDSDMTLKYGCPTSQNIKSRLVKTLAMFQAIKEGDRIDPEKILIGKKVKFMTMVKESERGKYVEIVHDSLKPSE